MEVLISKATLTTFKNLVLFVLVVSLEGEETHTKRTINLN